MKWGGVYFNLLYVEGPFARNWIVCEDDLWIAECGGEVNSRKTEERN